MNTDFESVLLQNALKLKESNKLVIQAIADCNVDQFGKLLDDFIKLKKTIRADLIDRDVVRIDDKKAQEILRKISWGEDFPADQMLKAIAETTGEELDLNLLEDYEIEEMGSNLFYSWYSHYEYINNLYSIGVLVVGISVPDTLRCFVSEARRCYAFQQYNAVYSLCRTILEASVKDVCSRKFLNETKTDKVNLETDSINSLINKVAEGELRNAIKSLYYGKTSPLVHGNKTINSTEAGDVFKETLKAVQELYSSHGF